MVKKIAATFLVIMLVGWGIWSITGSHASRGPGLTVVASYYPLYDFAREIGGDKIQLSNMTPAGSEPHDFEPSAKKLATAAQAEVFLYNGDNLEPWTDKFVQSYKGVAVKASSHIILRKMVVGEAGHQPADDVRDPHFWLDPILAQQIVRNIRDGLSKADPANAGYYTKRAADYNRRLSDLDQAFRRGLTHCQQTTIVVSHQATGYLAARYRFEVQAIAGVSPEDEPSAARLAELSGLVRQKGIGYIFFESLVSPRLAATIARETGAQTLVLDPIEGLTDEAQKSGENYLSLQKRNLGNLRRALACQ